MAISDEELARQSQSGSLAAFEELVRRYEGRIYAFAVQSCGGADAPEVTQDTFVRAYRAIAQFDSRRSFVSWLFGIARHRCIDHHRAALPETAVEQTPDLPDTDDPAELMARREEAQNLWRLARRCLPDVQFQALWLRYTEDMNLAEIAKVLRKTQTHVKVLLFRARQALSEELKSAGRVTGDATRPAPVAGKAANAAGDGSGALRKSGPLPA